MEIPILEPVATKERLARALEEAGVNPQVVQAARDGYFDALESALHAPIAALAKEMQQMGRLDLAARAQNGEFDPTPYEIEKWAQRD